MALGGGTFITQNKKLPGAYINIISTQGANPTLSSRGTAAMALELDWGMDNQIITVTSDEFKKNSLVLFGYDYSHEKLKGLRDLFLNTKTLYTYKLNSNGTKASNDIATAKYSGVRGNDIKIAVQTNVDNESKFDVITYLDTRKIDTQTVTNASELIDNEFVDFKKEAPLSVTVAKPLTGGTNGSSVTSSDHQSFLNLIESYSFNAIGVVTENATINKLYSEFVKRIRDEYGMKTQSVTWRNEADYEGNVNVKNEVIGGNKASLCYWVTGIIAGCEVNKSNTNKLYDGEFIPKTSFTQAELETCIDKGEFVLHQVGENVRVLLDINSLVTTSDSKGDIFKDNQTIRVADEIANSIANLFNTKYLGSVTNNESGRVSLWTDIVMIFNNLATIKAIEEFNSDEIVVEQGDNKKSVVVTSGCSVAGTMAYLYMTTTIE